MRASRERRRGGLFLAEGPREVERAWRPGCGRRDYHSPELLDWDEGEAGERARAREDGLPRGARGSDRDRRDAPAASPARRDARARGGRDREAGQPRRAGSHGGRRRRRRAGRRRRARRSLEPERDSRVDRRGVHAPGCGGDSRGRSRPRRAEGRGRRRRADTPYTRGRSDEADRAPRRRRGRRARRALARAADVQVSIPIAPGRAVDSLNTATAAAILLFEAVRQRG